MRCRGVCTCCGVQDCADWIAASSGHDILRRALRLPASGARSACYLSGAVSGGGTKSGAACAQPRRSVHQAAAPACRLSQEDVLRAGAAAALQAMRAAPRTLIVVGAYAIGKERVYLSIAQVRTLLKRPYDVRRESSLQRRRFCPL